MLDLITRGRTRVVAAAATLALAAGAASAAPASAEPVVTGGLVNITITNILNNSLNHNTVTIQVPVDVAANVCAQVINDNPALTCTASTG